MTFLRVIHIHPLLWMFFIISFITGTFVQLFILFIIIFIHELGHYLMAKNYKWHIDAVVLWVFGGVMKTADSTSHSIKEDVMVTIFGPFQHVLIYLLLLGADITNLLPASVIQMGFYYNWVILLFNLLPIYPLDGGKLLFYGLCAFLPYKKAHLFTVKFSILACICIVILQLLLFPFTLTALLLIFFILLENRNEWRHHTYIFIRFLLNRKNNYQRKKILVIPENYRLMDVFYLFRRNRYHYIKLNSHVMSETEALHCYFHDYKQKETITELLKNK